MRTNQFSIRPWWLVTIPLAVSLGCTPPNSNQQPPAASPQRPVTTPQTPPPSATPGSSATPALPSGAGSPAATGNYGFAPPKASEQAIAEAAKGNNAFCFDVYRRLTSQGNGNLIFSPLSISAALAMTWAGAVGKTQSQMAQALHFTLPQQQLHPAVGNILYRLQPKDQNQADGFSLHIANSLWVDKKFKILDSFSHTVTTNYGASTQLVDFHMHPDDSRLKINQWVADKTQNKIQDLLGQGTIKPNTRVVLVNAIYFHAQWLKKFNEQVTKPLPFHTAGGATKKVPTMVLESHFQYAKGPGFQALQLPYRGPASMIVVLPDRGKLQAVEKALSPEWFQKLDRGLNGATVNVQLPKFHVAPETVNLKGVLIDLGMKDAFNEKADFSKIDGAPDLFITGVYHKAFIDVDEKGTEAAAATAAVLGLKAMPMPTKPIDFHVDRPFLFFIRDNGSGTILFAGRVTDPSVQK